MSRPSTIAILAAFRKPLGFSLGACLLSLLFLLLPHEAAASTVAVFDLDGIGVSHDTTQNITQGLRDGFLEQGRLDPLTGYQIGELLASGQEDRISQARELMAHARQQIDSGNIDAALNSLSQAMEIHEAAYSWVARKPELADVHYFTALALIRWGRTDNALAHLVQAFSLYPGYGQDRAVSPPAALQKLFVRAEQQVRNTDQSAQLQDHVDRICDLLGTDYLVLGTVEAGRTVELELLRRGELLNEVSEPLPELPIYPGDEFFLDLVEQLLNGLSIVGTIGTSPSPVAQQPVQSESSFHALPELEQPEETQEQTTVPVVTSRTGTNRSRKRIGKIKATGGAIRYHQPIYRRWWFWTGVGVLATGGGVAVYVIYQDNYQEPESSPASDSYSVVVELSTAASR